MISASDLSEEQIEAIRSWVEGGAQMAEVQRRLKEDFGLNATYMDTRFLSLDLDLKFQVDEEEEDAKAASVIGEGEASPPEGGEGGASGEVTATLDQVARPGAMVSGTVTFSDGVKGLWLIDEMGRPSIDPDQPGYQPSEADLMSFQEKLRVLLDGKI